MGGWFMFNMLAKIEHFLKRFVKYPVLISVAFNLLLFAGWVLDHTGVFRNDRSNAPIVNVFPGRPESSQPLLRAFRQFPPYRSLTLKVGGSLTIAPSQVFMYSVAEHEVEGVPALFVKVAGDVSERVFRLDPSSFTAFTLNIRVAGSDFLLSVEAVLPGGI